MCAAVQGLIERNDVPGSDWHLPSGVRAPLLEALRTVRADAHMQPENVYPNWMRFEFTVTGGNVAELSEAMRQTITSMLPDPIPAHNVEIFRKFAHPLNTVVGDDRKVLVRQWEGDVEGVVRWA